MHTLTDGISSVGRGSRVHGFGGDFPPNSWILITQNETLLHGLPCLKPKLKLGLSTAGTRNKLCDVLVLGLCLYNVVPFSVQ